MGRAFAHRKVLGLEVPLFVGCAVRTRSFKCLSPKPCLTKIWSTCGHSKPSQILSDLPRPLKRSTVPSQTGSLSHGESDSRSAIGSPLLAMYVARERRLRVSEAPMWLFSCGFRGSSLRHGAAPRDRCCKHTGNNPVPTPAHAVRLLSSMLLRGDAGAPFGDGRGQGAPAVGHLASFSSVVPLPA